MSENIFLTSFIFATAGCFLRWFVGESDIPTWFKGVVVSMIFGGGTGMFVSIIYRIWE